MEEELISAKTDEGGKIASMKALRKAIKDKRVLVFVDLEGTQLSHEMIEIGAYTAFLDDDLRLRKRDKGFSAYVKATHPIGRIVEKMTGITEKTLETKGISFPAAMTLFQKYLKKNVKNCVFVTFGNFDLKIIEASVYCSGDASKEFARHIHKNYLDFSAFLATYVRDDNNNPYSLTNYLKVFGVPFEGKAHDAKVDALNLMDLYEAFLDRPDVVQREYKKTLCLTRHLPKPIATVLRKLSDGDTVTPIIWENAIKDSLQ
ncbi:MAG: exonuclease domain-containing protein [Bacilli bacterium]|jgi:DNA polymerase III epsilon subunit-like protein|nr:exonuclease domain-containing protein [Bacilli bacterium]